MPEGFEPSPEDMGLDESETEIPEVEDEMENTEESEAAEMTTEMSGEDFEAQKLAAQAELHEQFGMKNTAEFRQAIEEGRVDDAQAWLSHIEANRDRFPQYDNNWVKDRRMEIGQAELFEQFGMRKTADFRAAIKQGQTDEARAWLDYIQANQEKFPQYTASWFADREAELG